MAIKTITVDGATYPIGVEVSNIEGTIPISKGGTGATTAAAAKAALGISDTDTKVNQTTTTVTNTAYPLLVSSHAGRAAWENGAYEAQVHPLVTLNVGNAKMSIGAGTVGTGVASGSGYNLWENTNEKFYGSLHYGRLWASATTPGLAILSVGNDEAAATAGSASGEIDLYSITDNCAKIVYSDTASASRKYTIPNVAASDFVMTAGVQTITGNKTFDGAVYFGGTTSYYVSTAGNSRFHNIIADGKVTLNSTLVGTSGDLSTGNYTTTVPTSAGQTGQMMFVLQ